MICSMCNKMIDEGLGEDTDHPVCYDCGTMDGIVDEILSLLRNIKEGTKRKEFK